MYIMIARIARDSSPFEAAASDIIKEATIPPVRGGVATIESSFPKSNIPKLIVITITPKIPANEITTTFHCSKSSFKLINVPI